MPHDWVFAVPFPGGENVNIENIAMVAHEINRAYCRAIGDDSQVPWDEAPEWQKESCMNGVAFHQDGEEKSPEESHANWMAEKEADGWVYGEEKDVEKKTHPCMVPFNELPEQQRVKDFIFSAVVAAMSNLEPVIEYVDSTTMFVKYIGRRPFYNHNRFGMWTADAVKEVPRAIAEEMLTHKDVFAVPDPDEIPAEPEPIELSQQEKEELEQDQVQEMRDRLMALRTKQEIIDFIKSEYNHDIAQELSDSGNKTPKKADLQQLGLLKIDQYGII